MNNCSCFNFYLFYENKKIITHTLLLRIRWRLLLRTKERSYCQTTPFRYQFARCHSNPVPTSRHQFRPSLYSPLSRVDRIGLFSPRQFTLFLMMCGLNLHPLIVV